MGSTRKVKTTGRFGSRYGVGIRKRVIKVETKQKQKHTCPECGFKKVKRLAAGLYVCNKCSLKFAGGAYIPVTMSGSIVKKMVTQKSFLPYLSELIDSEETEAGIAETTEEAVVMGAAAAKPKPKKAATPKPAPSKPTTAKPKAKTATKAKPKTTAKAKPKVKAKTATKPKAKPKTKPKTKTKPKAKPKPKKKK